ncbi:helix-turn-helix domain-containing protein [Streptomyces sp. NPDC014685]|uniref:helix-turn-helix domain-containing protein n=1 Tax=Streptomyces sp. NPDC014685 TaxID=3364881 RepID=UPI0036F91E89
MHRLRIDKLWEAANKLGDTTAHAIYKRTGIAESSVYRFVSGQSQPGLDSALLLAAAYDVTVEELMERTDATAESAA